MDAIGTKKIDGMLSEEEIFSLGVALARGMGEFTEEELDTAVKTAVRWASRVRIRQDLLDLVLEGMLSMRIDTDGEPRFFAIGDLEKRSVEA